MKNILPAIKTALQAAIDYVADADIFITPDIDYIPNGTSFPCIAIKDGAVNNRELVGGCIEKLSVVSVVPYVDMADDEDSIVGSIAIKGVLEIVADIETALNNNALGLSGVLHGFCEAAAASELVGDEREPLQRIIITVTYEQEE